MITPRADLAPRVRWCSADRRHARHVLNEEFFRLYKVRSRRVKKTSRWMSSMMNSSSRPGWRRLFIQVSQ